MSTNIAGPEIERLVQLLARLPGLGPRSARRVALHLGEAQVDDGEVGPESRGGVDRCVGLGRRERAILQMGQGAGIGTIAERRIFRRLDVAARFGGGLHVRRNDAERPGIEDALHVD